MADGQNIFSASCFATYLDFSQTNFSNVTNVSVVMCSQLVGQWQQTKSASKSDFCQLCGIFVPKNTAGLAALRLPSLYVHSAKHSAATTATVGPFQCNRWKTKRAFFCVCVGHEKIQR